MDMQATNLYDIDLVTIDGKPQKMDVYRSKTLLIVNVASQCGFTPQYQGLQALYDKFKDKQFVVLGFPCNQFGHQEPGNDSDILCFTKERYSITFPLFSKLEVNGEQAHPLYKYLKHSQKGLLGTEFIKWNFTKFLVDRQGDVVARFAPATTPSTLEARVAQLVG